MARPPSVDLAAAMEADLRSHDPMSTRPHETQSPVSRVLMSPSAHETMNRSAQESMASVAHDPMSQESPDGMGPRSHGEEGTGSHGLTSVPETAADRAPAYVPPSRAGMKRIQGYFSPRVKRQLRLMAVNHDISEEDLVGRALNLLFKSEGLPEIAFDNKEQRRWS